ncbi:MAG: 2Fe-2S iron-sulfur cluster-binding protein [Motiliproteus sp.]
MTQSATTADIPKQIYQIRVLNRDRVYLCEAGKSLLIGMEQVNADCIDVGCRGGGCGMCKIRILEGDFQTKKMSKSHIGDKDVSEGFALACRTFPSSDMAIESDHVRTAAVNCCNRYPESLNNQATNNKDNAEDK